jgi:putative transposase
MILTHKTECFPNKEQVEMLEKCFGMRRFYFNKSISYLKHKYGDLKNNVKSITAKEVMSLRKDLFRDKYHHLVATVPSAIIDTSMEDVMFSLNSLWKKGKEIKLRKKKNSNTCRFFRKNDSAFKYQNNSKYISLIRLPNLKLAEPIRWSINASKDIKTTTIKKVAGRYFISITIDIPEESLNQDIYLNKNTHLGIDWGLKTYLTCFDGEEISKIDFDEHILCKLDKKISKYNKKLSRKILNSNNFKKVTTKLQQAYLDFNNYRLDFIKKVVNIINTECDTVSIENLNMKFSLKNRHLAKRTQQKPYYLFKQTLINKFNQYNKNVFYVGKTFPSTQMCSSCGNIKKGKDKMKLGMNIYECNKCGSIHDRDDNAAKNIYNHKNLEKVILN